VRSAEQSLHNVIASVGFASYFLLWLTVMWGMLLRNGWALTWVRHSTLLATHTTVALLGLVLGVVHATAQLAKPGALFQLIDILVPFAYYRDPIGVGVGVIGLEVMISVALSIIVQRWLGYSRWRAMHTMTYVAFTLIVAHILISGSDSFRAPLQVAVLATAGLTLLTWFISTPIALAMRSKVSGNASVKQRSQEITVNVDARRCAQFGFCEHEAPEVFRLRSDGRLAYRASVPTDEATPVIRAAEVCPARAIILTRVPTTVLTPGPPAPPDYPVSPAMASGPRRRTPPQYRD
jgi:ferredoxin/DMSO/TMAO reductase YedYZ heme-binding membrane subunit